MDFLIILNKNRRDSIRATRVVSQVEVSLIRRKLLNRAGIMITLTVRLITISTTRITSAKRHRNRRAIRRLPRTITARNSMHASNLTFARIRLHSKLLNLNSLQLLTNSRNRILSNAFSRLKITNDNAGARKSSGLLSANGLRQIKMLRLLLRLEGSLLIMLSLRTQNNQHFSDDVNRTDSFPSFLTAHAHAIFALPSHTSSLAIVPAQINYLISKSVAVALRQ